MLYKRGIDGRMRMRRESRPFALPLHGSAQKELALRAQTVDGIRNAISSRRLRKLAACTVRKIAKAVSQRFTRIDTAF